MKYLLKWSVVIPIILAVVITIFVIVLLTIERPEPTPTDPANTTQTTQPSEGEQPSEPSMPSGSTKPSGETSKPTDSPQDPTDPDEPPMPTQSVPADHVHSYGETKIMATCLHEGYSLFECSCGDSYKENIQPVVPHKYTSKVVSPTTEEKGYTLHTCSTCGDQYKDNYTDRLEEGEDPPEGGGTETGGNPDIEDYGYCPKCGRRLWTSWYPEGCFTFLRDTVCDCGKLVHAMECHHH